MLLLFVLGTLCAVAITIFYRRRDSAKNRRPKIEIRTTRGFVDIETAEWEAREEYRRKQEASLLEHTDKFFARPIGAGYAPPFPHKKEGYVPVEIADEYPNPDQRYIFEWFVENLPKILSDASALVLTKSSEHFTHDEASRAFTADGIERITLAGFHPVKWTIFFDTDISRGETLRSLIEGEDQRMIAAKLYM